MQRAQSGISSMTPTVHQTELKRLMKSYLGINGYPQGCDETPLGYKHDQIAVACIAQEYRSRICDGIGENSMPRCTPEQGPLLTQGRQGFR